MTLEQFTVNVVTPLALGFIIPVLLAMIMRR